MPDLTPSWYFVKMQLFTDLSQALQHAHQLLQEGHYGPCVQECGSLLEAALRRLYEQLLLKATAEQLQSYKAAEALIDNGKPYTEMGLGKLLGLFHKAHLFEKLEAQGGLKAKALKQFPLNQLVQLRNATTHKQYAPRESETHLAYYTLAEFLWQTRLVETLPSKGPDIRQRFSAQEVYSYALRLVPNPLSATAAVRKVLDDIAIEIQLSLKDMRALEQAAQAQPHLTNAPTATPSQLSSYAKWLNRAESATKRAAGYFLELVQQVNYLEIDYTHHEYIQFKVGSHSWMHLAPTLQGFELHLPDPGFVPPGPSQWFCECQELLKEVAEDWVDVYPDIEWDSHHDEGEHPIWIHLPLDLMTEWRVTEKLLENYQLFCHQLPPLQKPLPGNSEATQEVPTCAS